MNANMNNKRTWCETHALLSFPCMCARGDANPLNNKHVNRATINEAKINEASSTTAFCAFMGYSVYKGSTTVALTTDSLVSGGDTRVCVCAGSCRSVSGRTGPGRAAHEWR